MLPAVLSDNPLCGFDHSFGHSEAPDKKIRDRSSIFFCPLFFCPMAETMIKANKPFYFKPCGPPRPILGLLRLKSVPFLAVKRPLEQAERLWHNPVWHDFIWGQSHGGDYCIEYGSEVDGGVKEVIAFVNLSDRRDGVYLSAFDLTAHD
jgi:hypothetical protein